MKQITIYSKSILMMKYNHYPITKSEEQDEEENVSQGKKQNFKVESEAKISIESGDRKSDKTDKVFRIVLNLTESIRNANEEKDKDDVIRDFSIKIYYYLKSDNEDFSEMEHNFITLAILLDLNQIVVTQTSLDNTSSMDILGTIEEFKNEKNLSNETLVNIEDSTK